MNDKPMRSETGAIMDDVKKSAKSMAENPIEETKKSSEDWVKYIQTHPLQALLFGIVGYFAIKGIIKND